MYAVNRHAVIIKGKKPFLDWINQLNDEEDNFQLTLEQLRSESNTYLVPETEMPEETIAYIDEHFDKFFQAELSAWALNDEDYPKNRTLQMFWDFFDVEVSDIVVDMCDEDLEYDENDYLEGEDFFE
ncbi:MAG: hypothetical protein IK065_02790 [Neisseriaceae bacterium]|nr:hypothetical protein [Neisseriaceae bacterium]